MAEELVTVRVAQGELRGKKVPGRAGAPFYSFQGIPFAKPPVGPLRFKDPQPPASWKGVRDALKEGDMNTQLEMDFVSLTPGGIQGSEDCLYLNVFAPESVNLGAHGGPKLPVMVSIHGGGFALGAGNSEPMQGPDLLITENVVVVSINYRLGVFGFLSLGHAAAPGNYGLKDQVMALRWVRQNIEVFGGDAGNVTIFGISAGGASVHYHMISPMSNGLFHRAIAQSGCALNPWAGQRDAPENARRLAKGLGCESEDPEEIVAFLRQVEDKKLYQAAQEFAKSPKEKKRLFTFLFVPTAEEDIPGVEPFLPASARHLVEDGRHHAVPFMTGFTSGEGLALLLFRRDIMGESGMAQVDAAWEENVVSEARSKVGAARLADAARQLREQFLGGGALSKDSFNGFVDMFSDLLFGEGIYHVVKKVAQNKKAPVYLYYFNQETPITFFNFGDSGIDVPGVSHGGDIFFVYQAGDMPGVTDLPEDHPVIVTRRRVLRLWANFARTGNPTPEQDKLLGVRWEPYTEAKRSYLEIAPTLRAGTDLLRERFDFWERFYATFLPQRSEAYRERVDFWRKRASPGPRPAK